MSTARETQRLRDHLAELESRLAVLQRNKIWTSAETIERKIINVKKAIHRTLKETSK